VPDIVFAQVLRWSRNHCVPNTNDAPKETHSALHIFSAVLTSCDFHGKKQETFAVTTVDRYEHTQGANLQSKKVPFSPYICITDKKMTSQGKHEGKRELAGTVQFN